jgi:hypothetical protein
MAIAPFQTVSINLETVGFMRDRVVAPTCWNERSCSDGT